MKLERQIEELQALHASQWLEVLKHAPENQTAFREWCAQSPVHIREFLEITCVDRDLALLDMDREEDSEALLQGIRPHVRSLREARIPAEKVAPRRRPVSSWKRSIAAVLAVSTLGLAWFIHAGLEDHEYSTRVGELRTVQLVDLSVVTLNTNSDIRIEFRDDVRDVQLRHGEAVFKVAHDPARPFRVHTRVGVVQAVGTQFNVYDRPEGVDVAVLEGRVRLMPRADGHTGSAAIAEELVAGQQARIRPDGTIERAERADVERVIAWSKRRLKFHNASLEEIVQEFNRYNNNIRLRTEGVQPGSHRYTAIFDADDPTTLARFLEQEPHLIVERGENEILIRARQSVDEANAADGT